MILYYITKATFYSLPKNEDTIQKKFKPKVYHQGNHLVCFFSSYCLSNEKEESNRPQICLLILEARKTNSLAILESSSIKLSKKCTTSFSSLSFKLMEIIECGASLSSQCLWDWFKTQAMTKKKKKITIIWKMSHVKGSGIRSTTFTIIYLL